MLDLKNEDELELGNDLVLHGIPELEMFWIFNISSGDQFSLNEAAYFILSRFVEPRDINGVIAEYRKEFGISIKVAEHDCLEVLSDSLKEGILKRR